MAQENNENHGKDKFTHFFRISGYGVMGKTRKLFKKNGSDNIYDLHDTSVEKYEEMGMGYEDAVLFEQRISAYLNADLEHGKDKLFNDEAKQVIFANYKTRELSRTPTYDNSLRVNSGIHNRIDNVTFVPEKKSQQAPEKTQADEIKQLLAEVMPALSGEGQQQLRTILQKYSQSPETQLKKLERTRIKLIENLRKNALLHLDEGTQQKLRNMLRSKSAKKQLKILKQAHELTEPAPEKNSISITATRSANVNIITGGIKTGKNAKVELGGGGGQTNGSDAGANSGPATITITGSITTEDDSVVQVGRANRQSSSPPPQQDDQQPSTRANSPPAESVAHYACNAAGDTLEYANNANLISTGDISALETGSSVEIGTTNLQQSLSLPQEEDSIAPGAAEQSSQNVQQTSAQTDGVSDVAVSFSDALNTARPPIPRTHIKPSAPDEDAQPSTSSENDGIALSTALQQNVSQTNARRDDDGLHNKESNATVTSLTTKKPSRSFNPKVPVWLNSAEDDKRASPPDIGRSITTPEVVPKEHKPPSVPLASDNIPHNSNSHKPIHEGGSNTSGDHDEKSITSPTADKLSSIPKPKVSPSSPETEHAQGNLLSAATNKTRIQVAIDGGQITNTGNITGVNVKVGCNDETTQSSVPHNQANGQDAHHTKYKSPKTSRSELNALISTFTTLLMSDRKPLTSETNLQYASSGSQITTTGDIAGSNVVIGGTTTRNTQETYAPAGGGISVDAPHPTTTSVDVSLSKKATTVQNTPRVSEDKKKQEMATQFFEACGNKQQSLFNRSYWETIKGQQTRSDLNIEQILDHAKGKNKTTCCSFWRSYSGERTKAILLKKFNINFDDSNDTIINNMLQK